MGPLPRAEFGGSFELLLLLLLLVSFTVLDDADKEDAAEEGEEEEVEFEQFPAPFISPGMPTRRCMLAIYSAN